MDSSNKFCWALRDEVSELYAKVKSQARTQSFKALQCAPKFLVCQSSRRACFLQSNTWDYTDWDPFQQVSGTWIADCKNSERVSEIICLVQKGESRSRNILLCLPIIFPILWAILGLKHFFLLQPHLWAYSFGHLLIHQDHILPTHEIFCQKTSSEYLLPLNVKNTRDS